MLFIKWDFINNWWLTDGNKRKGLELSKGVGSYQVGVGTKSWNKRKKKSIKLGFSYYSTWIILRGNLAFQGRVVINCETFNFLKLFDFLIFIFFWDFVNVENQNTLNFFFIIFTDMSLLNITFNFPRIIFLTLLNNGITKLQITMKKYK